MANKTTKDWTTNDPAQVLKDVHESTGHALRTYDANSQIPSGFTRSEFTTNVDGSVILAEFYRGVKAQLTEIQTVGDVAGSLNSKYFKINTADDLVKYVVFFSIDGNGLDPALPGYVSIEINLSSNDASDIVALAIRLTLNTLDAFDCQIMKPANNMIYVRNKQNGAVTNASDGGTGFMFRVLEEGETEHVSTLELPYDGNNKYIFNYATNQFEIVQKTLTGELSPTGLRVAGRVTEVEVNATSWTALPSTALTDRNALAVQNPSGTQVKINYSNNPLLGYVGMIVYPNGGERRYDIKDSIPMYAKCESGTVILNVEEIS